MTLDEAVDRVVGHMQTRTGGKREEIRAVLALLDEAGVASFDNPYVQRSDDTSVLLPTVAIQDRSKAYVRLGMIKAALNGLGYSVVKAP